MKITQRRYDLDNEAIVKPESISSDEEEPVCRERANE